MAEYKIGMIDSEAPREWKGPKGTVYYITVGLEGHPKPVAIGKKTPDALKVGDTVYGEVVPTDYLTDNWKHGEAPQDTPHSSGSKKSDDYEPGTNARWAIGMAYRAYVNVMGTPEGADGDFPFDAVEKHARALVQMFENIKNGSVDTPQKQLEAKPVSGSSFKDAWDKATGTKAVALQSESEYTDADIPEDI